MNRVWVAPLGTDPDGPGWTEIGRPFDDGLVIIDDLPPAGPPFQWPVTITLTAVSPSFGWWRAYRDLIGITHPNASRVKRAYYRRRR
ncbi:hypothetical protein MF672_038905 [Actinomadura sp. ATCC 31491]|uniref:Uncharacterized protein n=1 Tax=Actinomadura luzonensis TaxID=2805427 RepID=A0ABT0G538_9ACTN|nr:hypothetical protein [Actinomadura luzonensis]MCK2219724.1 hypothetical protein [Actinomadura luzonensis]